MRLRIEYFDQNESFAPFLPRAGRVVAELSSTDGATDWFLLKLDEPFESTKSQVERRQVQAGDSRECLTS